MELQFTIDPDPRLDSNQVSVMLSWRIVEEGGRISFQDVTSSPQGLCPDIQGFFFDNSLPPVVGEYEASVNVDNRTELKTPEAMSGQDRWKLELKIGPVLNNPRSDLVRLLRRCPTDDEIAEAAGQIIMFALSDGADPSRSEIDQTTLKVAIPPADHIKPGFIKVEAVACANCGIRGSSFEASSLKEVFEHVLERMLDSHPNSLSIGEFGRAFVTIEDGRVTARVGFATHHDPASEQVNQWFADRFAQILEAVSPQVVRQVTYTLHSALSQLLDRQRQIAAAFGVAIEGDTPEELPADAMQAEPAASGAVDDHDGTPDIDGADDPAFADAAIPPPPPPI
ncbi:hypothetical protein HZA85_01985 [Candidatus Uhrbacteria bacterium]|nr:hypothetical protein [Candidatus Uhrbacteria bacterium]